MAPTHPVTPSRYGATVRAAVLRAYGPPEAVEVAVVDDPSHGAGELLVRVHATTVNRTDCAYRTATPAVIRLFAGLRRPRRPVLGSELAGVVEEVGSGVTSFVPGDRVFAYVEGRFGAHAELAVVRERDSVARIPDGVSFAQAAAATEGAHYALGLLRAAKVGPGSRVLVHGATGGIGSAAVQLAKAMGATVTAVARTAHQDPVAGLGPDRVVDWETTDFTADPERYDLVFDAVGKSTFAACRRLLVPRGAYASTELGPRGQNPVLAITTRLRRGHRVLFPIPTHDKAMVEHLASLLASGAFRPLIDRHYPLEEIAEAYRYVETGEKLGNVVVELVPA